MLKDILCFCKAPSCKLDQVSKNRDLILNNISLFFVHVIVGLVIIIPVGYTRILLDINRSGALLSVDNVFYMRILSFILLPFLEETAFRLSLIYSRVNISISFSAFISSFLLISFGERQYMYAALSFSLIFIILYGLLKLGNGLNLLLLRLWENNFRYVFFFLVVAFGSMHLWNFQIRPNELIFAPILVLPQIVSGIVYSYARIKFGFLLGFLQHLAFNFTLAAPMFFLN